MTDASILTQALPWFATEQSQKIPEKPPDLRTGWEQRERLPAFVSESATLMRCLELLAPLHWADLPERDLRRNWGQTPIPYHAFIAAELIRLNEALHAAGNLHQFLLEHPGFI